MTASDVALAASMILAAFAMFFAPEPWGIVGIAQFIAVFALYERNKMCYEEFIPGKVYKALCACSLKVKGTSTHKGLERPWYSPARHAIIATDTYMAIEVDLKTTEAHPCTFGGDDARVLAKDSIAFDTPLEFEPVTPSNWRHLIDEPSQARGNSYDPKLLDKVLKVAKAVGWDVIIDSAPAEIMRGRLMTSNHEEVGRFIVMPKQGIY